MFNNSGHSAHVRPIIDRKGSGYITGRQTIDRLSTAKEADTLQVVKRLDSVWQHCTDLHYTH